jgi:predicted Zn-dependent protease
LVEKYPNNPLFQLAAGDLYAKLGRRELAGARYRAAEEIPVRDTECAAHVQKLVQAALSSVSPNAAN